MNAIVQVNDGCVVIDLSIDQNKLCFDLCRQVFYNILSNGKIEIYGYRAAIDAAFEQRSINFYKKEIQKKYIHEIKLRWYERPIFGIGKNTAKVVGRGLFEYADTNKPFKIITSNYIILLPK